jgi:hypothetical protein
MVKLSKITIEIRETPFVLSPVLKYSCFKRGITLYSLSPQNVEIEPSRAKATINKILFTKIMGRIYNLKMYCGKCGFARSKRTDCLNSLARSKNTC